MPTTPITTRRRDLAGAALAFGFVVLLLASEAALTLPDTTDSAATVATFYAAHRATIIALQVIGFAAAALLAAYTLRLRAAHPAVAWAGLATAVLACAPGLATIALAVLADPASPATAERWNVLEARADDLLFVGVLVLATTVAIRLTTHPLVRLLGAATAIFSAARLVTEAVGTPGGTLDAVAPIAFIALIAALGMLSAQGRLVRRAKD